MPTKLTDIDPALGLMKEFDPLTAGTAELLQKMRQAVFTDGAVAAKYKTLGAVLWAISARCEPCIKFYVSEAAKQGATEKELGEFLAVASAMGGCVGEMWAMKAFHAYRTGGQATAEGDELSCCL